MKTKSSKTYYSNCINQIIILYNRFYPGTLGSRSPRNIPAEQARAREKN